MGGVSILAISTLGGNILLGVCVWGGEGEGVGPTGAVIALVESLQLPT